MKAFTLQEVENVFEIGCIIRGLVDEYEIEITNGKEAFYYALELAMQFEVECHENENYHENLSNFVVDKLLEKFGFEC